MAGMSKETLAELEEEFGLEEDGLQYSERVARIKKYQEEAKHPKRLSPTEAVKHHPLYGKKIMITPLMVPDAKRNLAFDEVVGHEIEVSEYNAGEAIYGAAEDVDRMVGDYKIIREDKSRPVLAKTTFPKIGTEITYTLGKDLCPIVRGNDGRTGYLWSYPTSMLQVEDTLIQIMGLKTMIEVVAPELLGKFKDKPMMFYIDGVTLAASIPMANAVLKEWRANELQRAKAGLL